MHNKNPAIRALRFIGLMLPIFIGFMALSLPLANSDAAVKVGGYFRKDGTYVQPHYRSNPDGNPYNNWSYPGNTNPYTGEVASGNPQTYLQNYYGNQGSTFGSSYGNPSSDVSYGGTSYYCNFGYYRDGEQCSRLPENAYEVSGSWQCYSGYYKQGDRCIAPDNGWLLGGQIFCKTGFVLASNNQCVTHTQNCSLHFGDHVTGSTRLGGGSSCSCESGYVWNDAQTACVPNSPTTSDSTGISAAELQKQINALLATIAMLQQQIAALQVSR
jgi:hypothetical protein